VGDQLQPVEPEEELHRHVGRALVAVDERVILGEAHRVGGSEFKDIRLTVVREVLRPRHGGLEQALVTHPRGAAMLGQLLVVDGPQHVGVQPTPGPGLAHFAP
jgi:hypothetical protein